MALQSVITRTSPVVEKAIVLLLVGVLGWASILVVSPFIAPFLWAVILTISTWPLYLKLADGLGGRRKLAAFAMTLLILLVLVIPLFMAFDEAAAKLPDLGALSLHLSDIRLDRPPAWLADLPLVGGRLAAAWEAGKLRSVLEGQNIRAATAAAAGWLLHRGADMALAALHVLLATAMAGVLYVSGERAAAVMTRLALRLGGQRSLEALHTAARTVRGVALGVMGTALIQAILSALGFVLAGVPAAPVLGLLCFLGAVMQIGTAIVWIPVTLWLGSQGHEGWAAFSVVWNVAINLMDNFLKPYLIGRSSPLPFLLILLGVIGGLLAWGFIGVFLGTTLLAVAYSVFLDWLEHPVAEESEARSIVPELPAT